MSSVLQVRELRKRPSLTQILLVVFLMCCSLYNTQIFWLRIIITGLIPIIPILLAVIQPSMRLRKSIFHYMFASILWSGYFVFWVIMQAPQLELNLSGANVEMLTPALFVSSVLALPVIANVSPSTLKNAIKIFFSLLLATLLLDILFRWYLEPECFLNYTCRKPAKTVGFFSTTNALATSFVPIVLSVAAINQLPLGKRILALLVLISTMARAALVSYFLVGSFGRALKINGLRKWFFILFLTCIIVALFHFDPFSFRGDGSGSSKIDFFAGTISLASSMDSVDIIFGVGASFDAVTEALGVNGWSPHAPILKAFLYFGMCGLALYVYSIFGVLKLHEKMWLPLASFVLLSLAGAPIFFPTFFACFAILRSADPIWGADRA